MFQDSDITCVAVEFTCTGTCARSCDVSVAWLMCVCVFDVHRWWAFRRRCSCESRIGATFRWGLVCVRGGLTRRFAGFCCRGRYSLRINILRIMSVVVLCASNWAAFQPSVCVISCRSQGSRRATMSSGCGMAASSTAFLTARVQQMCTTG